MLFPQPPRPKIPPRVVVTGAGIVTALGCGWRANADGFREGRIGFRPVRHFDVSRQRVKTAAEVDLPAALRDLDQWLATHPDADSETIQDEIYEIGKRHGFEPLRAWFQALYEVLIGSSQGPRMGTFIRLFGIANSRRLIGEVLEPVAT